MTTQKTRKLLENGLLVYMMSTMAVGLLVMLTGFVEKYLRLFAQGLNAASVAGLLVTTEALVAEQPEEAPAAIPGGGHDMGGMDF